MVKTRREIQEAVLNNDSNIRLIHIKESKSEVWRVFAKIEYDKSKVDFACCLKCKHVLSYTSKCGTGPLLRHRCISDVPKKKRALDACAKKTIPKRTLDRLAGKQLAFLTKDLLPFTVTEGAGFRDFAQELINIGAQYGVQRIDDLVSIRNTLTSSVMVDKYNRIKAQLIKDLANQQVALTTDMWTDQYTQMNFVTLTAHYISESFDFKVAVLGTRELTAEKKTGANILSLVIDILEEFGLKNQLERSVIVSDNEPIVVAAFSHYKRISCACHNLNLVIDDVFEQQSVPEISLLIDTSEELVQYFKSSELNSKLSKTLEQHIKPRWSSLYLMLNSIHEMRDEIKMLLLNSNEMDRLDGVDFTLLEQLITFLKPFKDCSEKLSSENQPTMHIFTLWSERLKKKCATDIFDSDVIIELKNKTLNSLKKRFHSTTAHLIGLFLNPPFKELNFLSEVDRSLVLNTAVAMLKEISCETTSIVKVQPNFTEHEFAEFLDANHSKKIKLETDDTEISNITEHEFAESLDANHLKKVKLEKDSIEVEIEKYCSMAVSHDTNILQFWKNATDLKLLQELAKRILAIPASSSASERVFSINGKLLNERRSMLLNSNLDKILFLNKNM